MKKIFPITAILASSAFILNSSAHSPQITSNEVIACGDYYANDTTPAKKQKRKSDTTRRDTTGLAFSYVASNNR